MSSSSDEDEKLNMTKRPRHRHQKSRSRFYYNEPMKRHRKKKNNQKQRGRLRDQKQINNSINSLNYREYTPVVIEGDVTRNISIKDVSRNVTPSPQRVQKLLPVPKDDSIYVRLISLETQIESMKNVIIDLQEQNHDLFGLINEIFHDIDRKCGYRA